MELKFSMSSKPLLYSTFIHSASCTSVKILHFPTVHICLRIGCSYTPKEGAPHVLSIHLNLSFMTEAVHIQNNGDEPIVKEGEIACILENGWSKKLRGKEKCAHFALHRGQINLC